MARNQKKRHHYIAATYLRRFCDHNGNLWVFPKDNPSKPFPAKPNSVAVERYFYSQPTPDGGQDNNKLEDFFSDQIEAPWPPLLERWENGDIANDQLEYIFNFIATMRARVPAARDLVESLMAENVKAVMRKLNREGNLPPPPAGYEDLIDHVEVAIDPHQSILAMETLVRGFGLIFSKIGLELVYNDTEISVLTSDNPVSYFDPDLPEGNLLPYTVDPTDGAIELLLPVTPKMVIHGHTDLADDFAEAGLLQRRTQNTDEIHRYNRMTVRFGYRFVISQDCQSAELIKEYSPLSPTFRTEVFPASDGEYFFRQSVFGPRSAKPKWNK